MGSWSGTCGLSNLSICEGDPVYLILLRANKEGAGGGGSFCHTVDNYSPIFVPIEGKYNDYGCITDIVEGEHTKAILEFVTKDKGANVLNPEALSLDVQDAPPAADLESVIRAIDRGDISFKLGDRYHRIGFMLIHKYIYDSVTSFHTAEDEDGFILNRLRMLAAAERHVRLMHIGNGEVFDLYAEKYRKELVDYVCNQIRSAFDIWGWNLLGFYPATFTDSILFQIPKLSLPLARLRKFYSVQGGRGMQYDNSEDIRRLNCAVEVVIRAKKGKEAVCC